MIPIIAIDPGASGGIAWIKAGERAQVASMPATPSDAVNLLKNIFQREPRELQFQQPAIVFMEQIVKFMGAGIPGSAMAVYATNFGILQGACLYAGARLELITAQRWQKRLGLGITGRQRATIIGGMTPLQILEEKKRVKNLNNQLQRDWKNKLKGEAQRLFPGLADQITLNTADALLILEYGVKAHCTGVE